ncbi:MAG: hypothetical protein NTX82_01510 [Candidatus Parcubacteria bacterium]|nr:hypothetical protein [Candidatus Parcubacteria bacterium]
MLSNKARRKIFGLALETVFENGDFFNILNAIQTDDQDVAIFTFKVKWQKVKRILIDINSWITLYEARELIEAFMKMYKIENSEIWESILPTDQDLFLFGKKKSLDALWQERQTATSEEKHEIDRTTIIRAIINTYMLETKIMQDSEFLRRLDVIFPQELQIVVNKLKSYQIRCSLEDLEKLINSEFPRLPRSYLNYIAKYYQQIMAGYDPVDFELPSKVRLGNESLEDEFDSVFADALVDEGINPLKTREPVVSLNEEQHSLIINLEGKEYKITVESISDLLLKMINDYSLDEIYDRVTDQLRTFRRHARDEDKLENFWLIIEKVENLFQQQWARDEDSELMKKMGNLISSLAILKTEMGNDLALLASLRLAKQAQNKAGT